MLYCRSMRTKNQGKVSVLVVSWNEATRLERCLSAVRRFLPDAQVVVVDNGSEPPLAVDADEVVRSEVNLGYAGGNNLGLEACRGEYVLLLNNDAYLSSAEPVERLVTFMEAHPQVGAAQARLVLPDGSSDACGELLNGIGLLHHCGYKKVGWEVPQCPYPVFAGKGACLLVRRSAIERAGGLFKGSYFCYYEDIDFCHRLWLAGYEVWFVPTEPVLHEEKATSRMLPRRKVWRQYLTNMLSSAVELWGWRFWLTRGVPFLCAILAGGTLKGVVPRVRCERLPFQRVRSEKEILAHVTVRAHKRFMRDQG